jgi:hypothetical protein
MDNQPKIKLEIDLSSHSEAFDIFENLYSRVNNKSVGRIISREEVFSKMLSSVTEEFVWNLQRESLSSDEVNDILRSHMNRSVMQ